MPDQKNTNEQTELLHTIVKSLRHEFESFSDREDYVRQRLELISTKVAMLEVKADYADRLSGRIDTHEKRLNDLSTAVSELRGSSTVTDNFLIKDVDRAKDYNTSTNSKIVVVLVAINLILLIATIIMLISITSS